MLDCFLLITGEPRFKGCGLTLLLLTCCLEPGPGVAVALFSIPLVLPRALYVDRGVMGRGMVLLGATGFLNSFAFCSGVLSPESPTA